MGSGELYDDLKRIKYNIDESIEAMKTDVTQSEFVIGVKKNLSFLYHLLYDMEFNKDFRIDETASSYDKYLRVRANEKDKKYLVIARLEHQYNHSFSGISSGYRETNSAVIYNKDNSNDAEVDIDLGPGYKLVKFETLYGEYINKSFTEEKGKEFEKTIKYLSLAPTLVLEHFIEQIERKEKFIEETKKSVETSKDFIEKFYKATYRGYPQLFLGGMSNLNKEEREQVLKYLVGLEAFEKNKSINQIVSDLFSKDIETIGRKAVEVPEE